LGVKSIPIHFVLDGGAAGAGAGGGDGPTTDDGASRSDSRDDSYVVVPGNTLFADLVHSVLARIGFTPVDALAAKGRVHRLILNIL